jgi:chromosome segregation ATPase
MMLKILLRLFVILLCIGLGLAAGLGYGRMQLKKEQVRLGDEIVQIERKAKLLQRKYTDQRAKADQLTRVKYQLEGKTRTLEGEIVALEKEIEAALAKQVALAKASKRSSDSLQKKLEAQEKRYAELKTKLEKSVQAHTETKQALKTSRTAAGRLENELQEAKTALAGTERRLERCVEHNARLCEIAEELVEKYRTKTVGDVLKEKEPFTQVGKIELEKFVQEYQDAIEAEQLQRKEAMQREN